MDVNDNSVKTPNNISKDRNEHCLTAVTGVSGQCIRHQGPSRACDEEEDDEEAA
jgi:hypothetical protein